MFKVILKNGDVHGFKNELLLLKWLKSGNCKPETHAILHGIKRVVTMDGYCLFYYGNSQKAIGKIIIL